MEVFVESLIRHFYSEEEVFCNCSPNTLKDLKLEWNESEHLNHRFREDIADSDIAFSICHIDSMEEYGYFFFNAIRLDEGNFLYALKKVVLDSCLPRTYIVEVTKTIVDLLNNGIHLRKDRIAAKENYPLDDSRLEDTRKAIAHEVLLSYESKLTGLARIPEEMMDKESISPNKQMTGEIRDGKQKLTILKNIENGNCMTAAEFCERLEQLKISLQKVYK